MGPYVVRDLQGRGHTVAALHRGRRTASLPAGVQHIIGDCGQIAEQRENITHFGPDVIIHFILSSGRQAEAVMQNLRGLTGRIVVLSSMDVYRAVGVTFGTEPGPPEPLCSSGGISAPPYCSGPCSLDILHRSWGKR